MTRQGVARIFGALAAVAIAAMVLLTVADVVLRAAFNRPIHGTYELIELLLACAVFLNENAAVHYIWKSIDGMKDIGFFYSGRVPEHIKLTSHGAKVLQKNCIRCHESTVEFINHERQCWECHRRIMHKRSGAMETI